MNRPIEDRYHEIMNTLAAFLDQSFNVEGKEKTVCFTLLVCEFGQIKDGRVNYISNGDRQTVVTMMKELIARFEGQPLTEGKV